MSFFFNDTATTEIYTLSLHDALPIWSVARVAVRDDGEVMDAVSAATDPPAYRPAMATSRSMPRSSRTADRKSTRLNSSYSSISYAVFCLKKKKKKNADVQKIEQT